MPPRVLAVCALLIALLLLLLLPPRAGAGTYDVYSCRLPDGSPAPARGWPPVGPVDAPRMSLDECASRNGLIAARLAPSSPVNWGTGWTFNAPAATTLGGAEIQRRFNNAPVETVRAGNDGRFTYTYKFRSIFEPTVYKFEARVPKQTGFPYLEGASKAITVRGRP